MCFDSVFAYSICQAAVKLTIARRERRKKKQIQHYITVYYLTIHQFVFIYICMYDFFLQMASYVRAIFFLSIQ